MSDRAAAYEDWKAGMKPAAIAKKYGVPVNTVKSWIARSKKDEGAKKDAPANPKRMHPSKPGAPAGNQNAKGNAGGGAPAGNQNHRIHGLYSFAFPESIQKLLDQREESDTENQLEDMIKFWEVREYQLLMEIERQRSVATGLSIQYATKAGKATSTTAISTFDRIAQLGNMLTSAQKAHTRCIEALHRIRKDDGEGGDGNLPALQATLHKTRIEGGEKDD